MQKRNISDLNQFLIDNENNEYNNYEHYNNNINMIKTEGNKSPNISPQNNKNNSKPISNYMKLNNSSSKNKPQNKKINLYNKNIIDIIKYTEEQLGSLDSEKHIKNAVKILENFQNELIKLTMISSPFKSSLFFSSSKG